MSEIIDQLKCPMCDSPLDYRFQDSRGIHRYRCTNGMCLNEVSLDEANLPIQKIDLAKVFKDGGAE